MSQEGVCEPGSLGNPMQNLKGAFKAFQFTWLFRVTLETKSSEPV